MIGVIEDRLIASVDTQLLLKPMPFKRSSRRVSIENPARDEQSLHLPFFHRWAETIRYGQFGCIPRFLKIHSEVNHVDQDRACP